MTIPSIVLDGFDAERRLHELGLVAAEPRDALLNGYGYAASCTSNNPLTLPGTMAWGFSLGTLRDILAARAWKVGRLNNFETVIHPSRSHAVAVTSGNARAGDRTATPRTRYRKGEAMQLAISGNTQMSLAAESVHAAFVPDEADPRRMHTWLLLHYYDRLTETIRAELSLPDYMENGWVTGWAERIMLDPIDFSTDVDLNIDDGDDDIDIDIARRAS
jgi:hypothetical protein